MSNKKTFLAVNFGCRVNMAEINQWSQTLIDQGFIPVDKNPNLIIINTCAITKKGELESIRKVRTLHQQYPLAKIIVTGCADLEKIKKIDNVEIINNKEKGDLLKKLNSLYTPKIKDKFTKSKRYLLKVQSGCTQFCSYCIVPFKRKELFSLPIKEAIKTVQKVVNNGYQEIIITGVNLNQYKYGFSNLIEKLLKETNIKLISFGSIPLNCIDDKFINLLKDKEFKKRISHFLHIPLQSGSDKILKLMKRPYTNKEIKETFSKLKKIPNITFGTDIIVAFPTETQKDFQDTYQLCKKIDFKKIHCFRYSPRPNTQASLLFKKSTQITTKETKERSIKIRSLNKQ